ncbi:Holliday junction resolvase RuvX [bacterium]|nr:Holliday junction resolvase RuvX [bacterium]NIN92400.1 Holliday junction resolvase RuvX [bacterium]NIO18514.1 Holliday junction resolvase RuvX [bacterium]NIO73510.1 Holliday junction resolvase RuvX [bacterium]
MKILGIDYGEKRIGLALSDISNMVARSLRVLNKDATRNWFEEIKTIVNENEIKQIVIGLPKNMNGSIGKKGKEVLAFVKVLEKGVKVPIVTWDERLTTVSAEKVLRQADLSRKKRKRVLDKLSACIILQNYLDSIGPGEKDKIEESNR